jgi:DNA-binding LacI/PurR family transcriptional regulator
MMHKSGVLNIAPHVNHPSIDLLRKEKIPTVLINCRAEHANWIDVDNVRGAMVMTEHLISLGHEKIVFINGFPESQNGMDRLKGFKKTLSKYNIDYNPKMLINGDFSVTLAYERMKHFLQQNKKMDFTAIFASNDYMAIGIIRALIDDNIRVPEDVAVVGFDDFNFSASFYIPLTTYRQPFHNIGYLATKLLLNTITSENHEPQQLELIGELVIRESCGARHRRQIIK